MVGVERSQLGRCERHRRAEQEALALHANYKVNGIEDLWALELKIREWRNERSGQIHPERRRS